MNLSQEALTDPSLWSKLIESNGIANTVLVGLMVFGLGFAWKVFFPLLKAFLQAKIHESKVIADSVPKMFREVKSIADSTDKIDGIDEKVTEIRDTMRNGGGKIPSLK